MSKQGFKLNMTVISLTATNVLNNKDNGNNFLNRLKLFLFIFFLISLYSFLDEGFKFHFSISMEHIKVKGLNLMDYK